ncbi:hypothetical protein [Sphingobacterium sp. LRF_L2]|uniref:hypothetical protein n=1 Tax=Sphingobacterium sp. LRF_L2 TaxID=3369421 RepID=UPI003F5F6C89
MGYFGQYFNEELPSFSVIIEDDDKVCYAYLLEENQIISDVWLYNHIDTPESVDWKNKEDLPFANPTMFVKKNISPFDTSTSINIQWGSYDGKVCVKVYASNILLAKLEKDALPGWSTLVEKDGPLALVYRT